MTDGYSRRDVLRRVSTGLVLTTVAISLPRPAGAQQKVAKAMVQYQDSPKSGHQCSGCSNFVAPSSCKVVSGTISPHGWCSIWTPK